MTFDQSHSDSAVSNISFQATGQSVIKMDLVLISLLFFVHITWQHEVHYNM